MITDKAFEHKYQSRNRLEAAQCKGCTESHGFTRLGDIIKTVMAEIDDGTWARKEQQRTLRREFFRQRAVARKEPTAKQIAYLRSLGYRGEVLDRLDASRLIERLSKRGAQ